MVDANLTLAGFLTTGSLTADGTSTAVLIGGEGDHEFWVRVPEAEANTTLDITLKASDTSGGTYVAFATVPQITAASITTSLIKYRRIAFKMPAGKPYLTVLFDCGGTIASNGFGATAAGIGTREGPGVNATDTVTYAARPTAP